MNFIIFFVAPPITPTTPCVKIIRKNDAVLWQTGLEISAIKLFEQLFMSTAHNLYTYHPATMPSMTNLDAVIRGLQEERDRLDKAISILTSLDGRTSPGRSSKRVMSLSARRRIAAAQRARWAKQKRVAQTSNGTARRKRRISAAGIARIRAAAKARWAKVRAAKKK